MPDNPQRAKWIDVARGCAILFVVMHHAGTYERALFSTTVEPLNSLWLGIELLLYHIRLPLFFFLSGTLASGHFSRSGRPRTGAALDLARTYCLWGILLLALAPRWPNDDITVPDLGRLPILLTGTSVAWYLWAIALCFGFAYLTRRLPKGLALILALGLSLLLFHQLGWLGRSPQFLARCLPFYLLGFRFPALGGRIVARQGAGVLVLPALFYLLVFKGGLSGHWAEFLLDFLGIGIGLLLVGFAVGNFPAATDRLAWMGRRTLPIYLLHFPIIAQLGCESIRHAGPLAPGSPLALVYVPVLSALSIAGSLLLHGLILRLGGQWLFKPPTLDTLLPPKPTLRPALQGTGRAPSPAFRRSSGFARFVTGASAASVIFAGWWLAQAGQADVPSSPPAPDTTHQCALWFVGSSSIRKWTTLRQDMAPWTTYNRSLGGATFAELTPLFVRDGAPLAPQAIILYAGENDIAAGESADRSLQSLRGFLAEKDRKFGITPVFILSVKPTPSRWAFFAEQGRYNEGVRKLAHGRTDIVYIDIVPGMLVNGRPGNFYVPDGIHMNHDGYRLWATAVRKALRERLPPNVVRACDPATSGAGVPAVAAATR